jgi:hypothetical protein
LPLKLCVLVNIYVDLLLNFDFFVVWNAVFCCSYDLNSLLNLKAQSLLANKPWTLSDN